MNKMIEVRPLTGAVGAEIFGVDLSRPLPSELVSEIRAVFIDYLVIFFRDQLFTPAQFAAFARQFGRVDPHHLLRGMEIQPEILEIIREPDNRKIFAPGWHADVTWQECPVLGAMLYGVDVPSCGGDTLFSNQYLAYEGLSAGMKKMLGGLRAVHGAAKMYGARADEYTYLDKLKVDRQEAASRENIHPVVRVHPESGRKALFVNDHYTLRFEDMTEEESRPLLQFLLTHAVKPEFTCRFRWHNGSIAFWDNRCTLHTPIDDYFGHRRQMWRITIAGDKPA
jgi:taurine dioxygenase